MGPWTQADLDKFGAEHGGIVRSDGPDANGVVTHHMADGAYVTMLGNLPRMVGHGAPPAAATETAPAQPAQRPGGGMDQAGLEAIINGFGPLGPGDFREEVKQEDIPNPAAYDENGQYILGAPLTIKGPVTYRTWIKPGTNIRLTVKVNQDGSYTQVFNGADSSIQPSRAPDAQAPKEEKNPNDPTRMRRWNPQTKQWEDAGPNQEEIDRRAKEQADRVGKPTGNTRTKTENGRTVKETEYLLPDGTKEWRTQEETAPPDRIGKPTGNVRERVEGGKQIKETEYILPDGTKEWREQSAPAPADKDAFGVEPEGAPEMVYSVGQMSAGLRAYSQWLSAQVKLHRDSGGRQGVAPQEATRLMERRIALAEASLKEQEGLANAQSSQRGQDITQRGQTLQETQSRRGAAERLQTNALSTFVPLAAKLGPGGGALLSKAIADTMASGRGYVDSFGGLRESPEIAAGSFPALDEIRRSSMAGLQTAAAGGPQIFDPRNPPSGAEVEAANQAAQAGFRGAVAPPANNPIDGTPITLPQQSSVNPPFGEPGNDPTAPVGMRPPMRALQEARYGAYFDPDQAGMGLSQRLGIPPEIMRQAVSGLYG